MAFNRKEYMREWMREWRKANPQKEKNRKRKYYQANAQKCIAAQKEWKAKNIERVRESARKRALEHKERRAGRPKPETCEICGTAGNLHWDHCHVNGMFRGWICFQCNAILGLAKDDAELLLKLSNYLRSEGALQIQSASSVLQHP